MFESQLFLKELGQFLPKSEYQFLKQLMYWSSHQDCYGKNHRGKIWIYNTLDQWATQLGVSKATIRRTIASLKEKHLIFTDYLSPNKRNRTLYYSLHEEGIRSFLKTKTWPSKAITSDHDEHMDEHVYKNKNKVIYKSYKSENNIIQKNKNTEKPTIIQDMIQIFQKEIPNYTIILNKSLARYLVAAFKIKFQSSLRAWKHYLKLIKTSRYLMGSTFKLSLSWIIKFLTIDRLRAGELGVQEKIVKLDEEDKRDQEREWLKKVKDHIKTVKESEKCRILREKLAKIVTPGEYLSWLTKIDFIEQGEKIVAKAISPFVRERIQTKFYDRWDMEFVE